MIKMKVAILNGYKMILPHYGKYNGVYGIFTTEGFVSRASEEEIEIETINYDRIINVDSIVLFNVLSYPEY